MGVRELKDRLDIQKVLEAFHVRKPNDLKSYNKKREVKMKEEKKPKKDKQKNDNLVGRKKKKEERETLIYEERETWIPPEDIKDQLEINGDGMIDANVINGCALEMVEKSKRSDVVLVDSGYSESKRFYITTFNRKIVHDQKVVLVPFFLRGIDQFSSHWMLIIVDQRGSCVKVFVVDSFANNFGDARIEHFIQYVKRAFQMEENRKDVVVHNVKITPQRTNWECGYRVLKLIDLLLQENLDVDCFQLFHYSDFMMSFITEIRKKLKT